ncbi:hypothetical protein ADL06_27120 [Streptomyces sp. NRRL F-6491]|nr:hypothetical protein ADL06_27120 [Streptomyces sp. NRRL F-6491]KOX45464.1 hypothetical protein ADL08_13770 [Streptomyces sp. NRRL F-6492]
MTGFGVARACAFVDRQNVQCAAEDGGKENTGRSHESPGSGPALASTGPVVVAVVRLCGGRQGAETVEQGHVGRLVGVGCGFCNAEKVGAYQFDIGRVRPGEGRHRADVGGNLTGAVRHAAFLRGWSVVRRGCPRSGGA